MRFSHWLRPLISRLNPTRSRQARRRLAFRPRIDRLEDRTVPSTVTWINPTGGDWDTASNWSTGAVPGVADDVVINYSGITITHSTGASDAVSSLSSQAAISLSTGSLSVATASTITNALTLSGGTLGGTGNLTVTGLFTWDSGTVSGSAGSSLIAEGGMAISGGTLDTRDLINDGAATVSSYLYLGNNAALINDGSLRLADDGTILDGDGSAGVQLVNAGSINRLNDPGFTNGTNIEVPFINEASGTVEVDDTSLGFTAAVSNAGSITGDPGTDLQFAGKTTSTSNITGDHVEFDGTTNLAGSFSASHSLDVTGTVSFSGCTVAIDGDQLNVSNNGSLDLTSGATLVDSNGNAVGGSAANPLTLDDLNLNGTLLTNSYVTLNGPDGFASGPFNYPGSYTLFMDGALSGGGTVTLAPGTTALLAGDLYDTLVNQGAATVYSYLSLGNNAALINDGSLRIGDNGAILDGDGSAGVQLVNAGSINRLNDPGFTNGTNIEVPFINEASGIVEVDDTSLGFTAAVSNAGSITGDPGTDLQFAGKTTSTSSITGDHVEFDGTANLAGSFAASHSLYVTGTVSFSGCTVAIDGDQVTVTNNGTLDLTSGATLVDNSGNAVGGSAANPLTLDDLNLNGTLLTNSYVTLNGPDGFTTPNPSYPGPYTLVFDGTLGGGGTVTLAPGTTALLASGPLDDTLVNQGAATVYSFLYLGNNAKLINDGSLHLVDYGEIDNVDSSAGLQLVNAGSITRSYPGGNYVAHIDVSFVNEATGTVEVDGGQLEFDASVSNAGSITGEAGTVLGFAGTTTSTSSIQGYEVGFGGTTNLAGSLVATHTLDVTGTVGFSGCTVAIAGDQLNVNNNGSLDLTSGATLVDSNGNAVGGSAANPLTLDDLNLSGTLLTNSYVTINGPDGFANGTSGPYTLLWTLGTLGGGGTVTLAPGTTSLLALSGETNNTLNDTLVNQGAASIVGSAFLIMQNNAALINDGTLRIGDGALIRNNDGSAGVQLVNAGSVAKSDDPGQPQTASITVPFINEATGTVEVDDGALQFTAAVSNAGSITADTSTDLIFRGTTTLLPSSDLTADTLSFPSGSSLNLPISGGTPGAGFALIQASTGVSLGGQFNFSLVDGYAPRLGDTLTVIDNQGSAPISNSFQGLPEGKVIPIGGYQFQISYIGGSNNDVNNNDVVLKVIQAPAKAMPIVSVTDAGGIYNGNAYPATATLTDVNVNVVSSLEGVSLTLDYQQLDSQGNVIQDLGTTAPTAAGSYKVTASFAGSPDYTPASSSTTFTIAQAMPYFSLVAPPTIIDGTPNTQITGAISAGTLIPPSTETVTVTVNGANYVAAINPDGTFAVIVPTASLGTGSYTIGYFYAGDNNFTSACATANMDVTNGVLVLSNQNQAKNAGSTIPIQIELVSASGQDLSSASITVTAVGMAATTDTTDMVGSIDPSLVGALQPVQSAGDSNPDNVFREQGGTQPFYMYNLQTPKVLTAGTYRLYFQVQGDPLWHWVTFSVS